MRRLLLLLALVLMPRTAFGQTTSVSGTITDAGAVIWKNGTYLFTFRAAPDNPTGNYRQNGVPFDKNTTISGNLDGTGSLTGVAVPDNLTIVPSGTAWDVQVCSAATASNGCFKTKITITGASQSITSSVTPPAIILDLTTPPPGGASAYNDGEVIGARVGSQYFNLTDSSIHVCTFPLCTWVPFTAGGTPGGSPIQTQVNNGGVFGGTACESFGNISTGPANVDCDWHSKGPNPWVDITRFGARSITGAIPQTTATCTSGQPTVTLASASSFLNGDGVTVYNCGPSATVSAPGAPSVAPGQSASFTVPDSTMISDTSGAGTYTYALVTRDLVGGLSAASTTTTINNGAAALGKQTFNISSISLTETIGSANTNALTVTTTSSNGLVVGTLVHIFGVSTAINLKGWYIVSSITNAQTFVINNVPLLTPLSDTTGTVTYWKGNRITFTNPTNGYETYVCAQRPGDSSMHVIGVSWPNGVLPVAGTTFTDWGSPVTTKPLLPGYVTDSICTGTGQNEPLTTTIVSGAGTTNLTLASSASNTTSGQTILYDDGPAVAAAKASIATTGAVILIPVGSFHVNSKQSLGSVSVRQEGGLTLGETLSVGNLIRWTGSFTNGGNPQFSYGSWPQITANGAWPGMDGATLGFSSGSIEYLTFAGSGNQAFLLFLQGSPFHVDHMNFSTGTSADYCGIALGIVGSFDFQVGPHVNAEGGPGQEGGGFTDASWCPLIYETASGTAPLTSNGSNVRFRGIEVSPRGILDYAPPGAANAGLGTYEEIYSQGPILPTYTLSNSVSFGNPHLRSLFNDTSTEPNVALLAGQQIVARVDSCTFSGLGGLPIQGTWRVLNTNCGLQNTRGAIVSEISGFAGDGTFCPGTTCSHAQAIYNASLRVGTNYPAFIDGALSAAPTCSISAGGSVPIGTYTIQVIPVWWNGAEGLLSPPSANCVVTTGNQTVTVNWTVVPGSPKGYDFYWNGLRKDSPPGVCASPSISPGSATSIVFSALNNCNNSAPNVSAGGPTMLMSGSQGIATPTLVLNGNSLTSQGPSGGTIVSTGYQNSTYDNFNRANGALSAPWVQQLNAINISSNVIVGTNAVNNSAYNSNFVPNGNSAYFVQATVSAFSTGVVGVGSQASGTGGSWNGYSCFESSTTLGLQYFKAGAFSGVLNSTALTPAVGDVIRLTTTINSATSIGLLCTSTNAAGTVTTVSFTDTVGLLLTGFPGVFIQNTTSSLDNWSAGNLHPIAQLDTEQDWTQPQHFINAVTFGPTNPVAGTLTSGAVNGFIPVTAGVLPTGSLSVTGTGACSSLSGQAGGNWSGSVACGGTTGASTLTITPGTTAPHGWMCFGSDVSIGHSLAGSQVGIGTTTCELSYTAVTSTDTVTITAFPF